MFSLSSLWRSIVHFSLSTVFPSFYVGLALSHFLLCTFFVLLFLSPYIFLEHFQRKRAEDDGREEEEQEESYRNRQRSELVDS